MAEPNPAVVWSPVVTRFSLSVAMRLVAAAGGALVGASVLTKEQLDMIQGEAVTWLAGAMLVGASLLYGVVKEYINRRKLLKAMALPFPVSEQELKERIKVGGAPSIATPSDQLPGPSTTPKPVETA